MRDLRAMVLSHCCSEAATERVSALSGAKMRRMNARTLEKEALELPPDKRAKLAQRLLQSLDDLSEAEAEKLWLEEASHRAREIDSGKVRLVKAKDLERRVRARLK